MPPTDPTSPPREPEIEFLGRVATRGLVVLRTAFWLAGAVAIAYGAWRALLAPEREGPASALGPVWVAVGVPLVLPVDWLFGRGRFAVLGISAALWFLPMLLPDDHRFGFVLRMFATLVACLSLLVWRTLWRLTLASAPG